MADRGRGRCGWKGALEEKTGLKSEGTEGVVVVVVVAVEVEDVDVGCRSGGRTTEGGDGDKDEDEDEGEVEEEDSSADGKEYGETVGEGCDCEGGWRC